MNRLTPELLQTAHRDPQQSWLWPEINHPATVADACYVLHPQQSWLWPEINHPATVADACYVLPELTP